MKFFAVLVVFSLYGALVLGQDQDQEQRIGSTVMLPLPLFRVRRATTQTDWRLVRPGEGDGLMGILQQRQLFFDTAKHRMDGSAYVAKDFSRNFNVFKPEQTGAKVDYTYKPSHSTVSVGADHTRGFGTDVTAVGRYNIIEKKNFNVGVEGQYNRHYGGPGGSGRPDYGVVLKAEGTF